MLVLLSFNSDSIDSPLILADDEEDEDDEEGDDDDDEEEGEEEVTVEEAEEEDDEQQLPLDLCKASPICADRFLVCWSTLNPTSGNFFGYKLSSPDCSVLSALQLLLKAVFVAFSSFACIIVCS